ncbi:MAG TPA: cytochrome c biogenesis protein ResB [Streptosporangiaceae bacterium]|nr:cytochrome c biogenesis protein ResB [Streptosporangiaceae bacterium]
MTQELTGRNAGDRARALDQEPAAQLAEETAHAAGTGGTPPPRQRFGVVSWLRWGWRQLTSMRTALVLLFLLALASIPGSVLPQEGIDPAAVSQYYAAHPALAPFLAKLSGFDVFGAPWFAAIYLLLFASLAGCVLPRSYRLARSARQPPPKAPRHLGRLPQAAGFAADTAPERALGSAAALLRRRRFRIRTGDGWVSAEKGYLHEVGNLLFHVALLGLLVSVALGGLIGYKANKLLVEGETFANTPVGLDAFHPGRLVSAGDLQPFSVTLRKFAASYITSGDQRGQPASFAAALRYNSEYGGRQRSYDLRVNHPLIVDGVQVFLLGHGYAPEFKVTDSSGKVRFDQAVPFIPVEQSGLTSAGVVKVPDAQPRQLGFAGVFLPTEVDVGGRLASAFPAAEYPRVSLVTYAGNLGLNSGNPQSVYSLDTSHMRRLAVSPRPLAPGQSITLPHGLGKLTFTGYRQWVSLAITYDPGQLPALVSALTALAGLILSFLVRRRRIFVRASAVEQPGMAAPDEPGAVKAGQAEASAVVIGGLTRSDAAGGFETEFAELSSEIMQQVRGDAAAVAEPGGQVAAAGAKGE